MEEKTADIFPHSQSDSDIRIATSQKQFADGKNISIEESRKKVGWAFEYTVIKRYEGTT